jgi:hypothetical protein
MQTCPVRVLLTGCATALLVVTGCDVGTASGVEPYGTNDVLRVFRSSGIRLESQQLEDGSTCPDPSAVAAIRREGVECTVIVGPAVGLPRSRAVLWNQRELGRWIIWVYDGEDDARALAASPLFLNRLGRPVRIARAGNVVAMYVDVEDGLRLRAALALLSDLR